jgi:N-acyl-D-amino-acid deacylase
VDATGQVVAPGFIDIQAHSIGHYMVGDGRAISMVTQGITTAIHGEGSSLRPDERPPAAAEGDTASVDCSRSSRGRTASGSGWSTWWRAARRRTSAPSSATARSASTPRARRKAAHARRARQHARAGAERDGDGAFGIASALIYPPNTYASTEELIEAAKAMAPYGGVYITHMRSEGDKFLEAIDEAMRIGREGGVPVEIYHLKASGPRNWPKMPVAIAKIDSARAAGQDVQAEHVPLPRRRELLREPASRPSTPPAAACWRTSATPRCARRWWPRCTPGDAGYENLCEIATPRT